MAQSEKREQQNAINELINCVLASRQTIGTAHILKGISERGGTLLAGIAHICTFCRFYRLGKPIKIT